MFKKRIILRIGRHWWRGCEQGRRPWKSKGSLPSEPAQRTGRMFPGDPTHWRTACTPLGQPAHRTLLACLPFSQGQAVVRTTHPTTIKTKTCGITWMVNKNFDLQEFKNQTSQCFAGNQRCPGVWNSFPLLAWDLSMHPRTQLWFFNQFICTGACACSSNLNYAHKCIENSVNA